MEVKQSAGRPESGALLSLLGTLGDHLMNSERRTSALN